LMGAYYGDTIKMQNVETIMFADQTITVETSSIGGDYYFGALNNSYDIHLTDVDDVIDSAGGNDKINGKGGDDTLLLYGDKADFEIITLAGLTKIYGLNSDGLMGAYYGDTIKMQNVETIMFADQTITVETSSIGGNYKHWGSTSGTTIDGTDGNDVIDSGGGNDFINGKQGDDTLLLFADRSTFEVFVSPSGTTIALVGNSADGLASAYWNYVINLSNVETIMFADQTVSVSDLISQVSSTGKPLDSVAGYAEINETNNDEVDENPLSDVDLWASEFDINAITLPETVMDEISSESFDLTDLYGLLGFQTDSLELNFETFVEDTSIEIEAVKPVDLSAFDPVLDHYQDSWLEDLVYSSELG